MYRDRKDFTFEAKREGKGAHRLDVDPVDEQAAALAAAGAVRDGEVRGGERNRQQEHGLRALPSGAGATPRRGSTAAAALAST